MGQHVRQRHDVIFSWFAEFTEFCEIHLGKLYWLFCDDYVPGKYHKLQVISERLSFARLVKCWWGKQGQTCQGFQLKATSFTVLSNKDIIFAHLQHFLFYGPEIFLLL